MEFTLKPSETQGTPPPPRMTCPKCGFDQPENPDCVKCGIVVARYKPSQTAAPAYTPPPPEKTKEQISIDRLKEVAKAQEGPGVGPLLGRVVRWAIVLGCVGILFMMFRPAPPPIVAMDPDGGMKAAGKLQAAQDAAAQGQSLALLLTEGELNAWLQASLQQSSTKDVKIHLMGDQIQAYTLFNLYGKDMSLQLTGKLQMKDGRLRLDATEGILGTLSMPKVLLGSVTSSLFDAPTNREKFVLPPQITNVEIRNSTLVISYKGATSQ